MYKLKAKSEGSSSIMVQEVSKSSFFEHLFLYALEIVVDHVMVHQDTPGDRESNQFRIRVGLDYFKQESGNQLEIELEFK
jgi:hypothetical protein